MENSVGNFLANASSAYLRSARHQPVLWHEWEAEAFAKAVRENKPILLDIGAVWCHWCHVMDRESYEDLETAALINENYIAIKVDRDERPDVDTRYQAAVSMISAQSGWPLTAFLTPEGKPYFGGTYFPPTDRYGRPSFRRVLLAMADAFRNKRSEVDESAESIFDTIERNETLSGNTGELNEALVEQLVSSIIQQFDVRNGGFGAQPKFPHSGAIDLLIDAASRPGAFSKQADHVVKVTLHKMAAGGICDQLAGGFHRYSVDEHWRVPHFEKMAYDNSELLKNYVHAFQTFLLPEFAQVAKNIVRWMDESLSDRENGGFYASQDADASLEDDGDFFTWTLAEAKETLSAEELQVTERYFHLRDIGDMHHNPQKNVLHVSASTSDIARHLSRSEQDIERLLDSAKGKMYARRKTRRTPYIDKTIFSGWNGMCISAYLEAARVLGMPDAADFALRSLDRLLETAWSAEHGLYRVVSYAEARQRSEPIAGVLDDYAFVANAALDAWQTTGDFRYFEAARQLADAMMTRFYDEVDGGFFDTERGDGTALGALNVRRKPIQDSPTPAGNSMAATVLLRLSGLVSDGKYAAAAQRTLKAFAGVVEHLGLHAASYGLAARRALDRPVQICIVGEDDDSSRLLLAAATARFSVGKSVVRLRGEQVLGVLPPALAETLPNLPRVDTSYAIVCQGFACLPPITDADKLSQVLNSGN